MLQHEQHWGPLNVSVESIGRRMLQDCCLSWPGMQPGLQWVDGKAEWRSSPCLDLLWQYMLSAHVLDAGCCIPPQLLALRKLQLCRGELKGSRGFLKQWWKVRKRLQAEDLSTDTASTGKSSSAGKLLVSFNLEKCTKWNIMKISILWKCNCYPGRSTG